MAFLLSYILRLTLNHRAFYCYMILSVWLIILIGMYKYVTTESHVGGTLMRTSSFDIKRNPFSFVQPEIEISHIKSYCNPHTSISVEAEGLVNSNFSLEGILILLRHGDRGPLTHIRNVSNVDCVGGHHPLFMEYEEFIKNITGRGWMSQVLSAFHGLPVLPGVECSLGQLTRYGALQLLKTGQVLGTVYSRVLGISSANFSKKDIISYSTRYRRTLQSALAFLYTFVAKDNFHKVNMQEVQSLAFCFDDCACPAADRYFNLFVSETQKLLRMRTSLRNIVSAAAPIVYELPDRKISGDPHSLKDALLTYVCHDAALPCKGTSGCVTRDHVSSLFSYLEWEATHYSKSVNLRYACLLRSYGLVRNIVSQLLRLVSERRPKVVLYSGHDKTISYITTALGIYLQATAFPIYASRLIFEVYRSRSDGTSADEGLIGSDYFFRLIFNGKDITHHIKFCKGTNGLYSVKNNGASAVKAYLCPIESIIRFLHEDYFSAFNTTNMKEACIL